MGEYKNLRESKRSQENPTESERIRVPKFERIRGNKKGYKIMWKNMREHEKSRESKIIWDEKIRENLE